MVSKINLQKIENFLVKHNYLDVYIFLTSSLDNLTNRVILIENDIKNYEEKIKEIVTKVNRNSNEIAPENQEISRMFKDLHYQELEIIQRINILIELLAVYYQLIRTNLKNLPKCIGKKDISPIEITTEFKYFGQQSLDDIRINFKYPNVKQFTELTAEEQNILEQLLNQSMKKILESFQEIDQFQQHFRGIYNKYKHTLSEFVGIFGIDKNSKQIQTHIYLRDKEKDNVYTYIVQVNLDAMKYFEEIATRVYSLLNVLMDNTLLFIINEEKDFIPRRLFIDKKDETNLKIITEKVQSCCMPNFVSKVIVKPSEPKDISKVNQYLIKNHIYKMNKDILNPEELLKDGISFSKS